MKRRPSVILADQHMILLEALVKLLQPEFEVVATVQDAPGLLASAGELRPDVIVVEPSMLTGSGPDAIRCLRAGVPHAKLVFLSMERDTGAIEEAFRAGAHAYVLKECRSQELANAVRRALTGRPEEKWLFQKGSAQLWSEARRGRRTKGEALTARQRQVVKLVAEGRSVKQIADCLGVSTKTVQSSKYQAMERLGIRSTADLVRYAVRHGLIGGWGQ